MQKNYHFFALDINRATNVLLYLRIIFVFNMLKNLLNKAIAGDKVAESELFAFLTVRFRYLAKRYITIEDAEDVAQEACLTIIEKYRREKYEKDFEAWAYGVLRKKIGNYLQRQATIKKNIVESDIDSKVVSSSYGEAEQGIRNQLVDCLKKINKQHPNYARVLNLIHQGYTTDEMCDMLRIKPNYLYVLLNRGRKMLRTCLDSDEV